MGFLASPAEKFVELDCETLRARSLGPLVKARALGMTQREIHSQIGLPPELV
jgi:hypothetical protein